MENKDNLEKRVEKLERELAKKNHYLNAVIYCSLFGFIAFGVIESFGRLQEVETNLELIKAFVYSIGNGLAIMATVAAFGCIGYLPINFWAGLSEQRGKTFYIKLVVIYVALVLLLGSFSAEYVPSLGRE